MKKLTIKDIVDFRSKSDRGKQNYASTIKLDKEKAIAKGGGDYWVTSISAISNSYKQNNLNPISEKRSELEGKYEKTKLKKTKEMYERNIDILYRYEDFDLNKWRPSKKIKQIKKNKENLLLTIKGFQIKVTPNHIFTSQKDEIEEIGAIWFIAKLGGLKKEELGMFTDILYRYLKKHYSKEYELNSNYCIAVDVVNGFEVNYSQIAKKEVPAILNSTLEELNKLI